LLWFSITGQYNEVQYPVFVVENIPIGSIARWEGNSIPMLIQLFLEVGYFVCKGKCCQSVLLFPPSNGGSEALGNVEDGDMVVLVELHHSFGGGGGDGACCSHGGPYGGQRAKGCLDHSVDGDVGHRLRSIGVVIRAGVVFAEPSVDESMVGGLVVDPQEEELSWLEVRLEFKGDDSERDSVGGEGLWFGCNCSG
jgi:hypothetical protein